MACHLLDGSINKLPKTYNGLRFDSLYLSDKDSISTISFDSWLDSHASFNDMILKLDIEGSEYSVIKSARQMLLYSFRIIVVEFHGLGRLLDNSSFNLIAEPFKKLLLTHNVVHIHPNNYMTSAEKAGLVIPEIMEFTFLRKNRFTPGQPLEYVKAFPHALDNNRSQKLTCPNCGHGVQHPSVVLPRCWYR